LNGQVFAAIALHCPVALLPGRREVFTMCRSAFLAAALLSIVQATRAESGLASCYGGHGRRGEMSSSHPAFGKIVTVTRAGHSAFD
jgi:hypothetical protein